MFRLVAILRERTTKSLKTDSNKLVLMINHFIIQLMHKVKYVELIKTY